MPLFESDDSNGAVSLKRSSIALERASMPSPRVLSTSFSPAYAGESADAPSRDDSFFDAHNKSRQIIRNGISSIDGKRRDPPFALAILRP